MIHPTQPQSPVDLMHSGSNQNAGLTPGRSLGTTREEVTFDIIFSFVLQSAMLLSFTVGPALCFSSM